MHKVDRVYKMGVIVLFRAVEVNVIGDVHTKFDDD